MLWTIVKFCFLTCCEPIVCILLIFSFLFYFPFLSFFSFSFLFFLSFFLHFTVSTTHNIKARGLGICSFFDSFSFFFHFHIFFIFLPLSCSSSPSTRTLHHHPPLHPNSAPSPPPLHTTILSTQSLKSCKFGVP